MCIPAPAGYFTVNTNNSTASIITPCPAGSYSAAGSSACTLCPIGEDLCIGHSSLCTTMYNDVQRCLASDPLCTVSSILW